MDYVTLAKPLFDDCKEGKNFAELVVSIFDFSSLMTDDEFLALTANLKIEAAAIRFKGEDQFLLASGVPYDQLLPQLEIFNQNDIEDLTEISLIVNWIESNQLVVDSVVSRLTEYECYSVPLIARGKTDGEYGFVAAAEFLDLKQLSEFGFVLHARAVTKRLTGNDQGAWDDCIGLMKFSRLIAQRPHIMAAAMAYRLDREASELAIQLRSEKLDLRKSLEELQSMSPLPSLEKPMSLYRLSVLDEYKEKWGRMATTGEIDDLGGSLHYRVGDVELDQIYRIVDSSLRKQQSFCRQVDEASAVKEYHQFLLRFEALSDNSAGESLPLSTTQMVANRIVANTIPIAPQVIASGSRARSATDKLVRKIEGRLEHERGNETRTRPVSANE